VIGFHALVNDGSRIWPTPREELIAEGSNVEALWARPEVLFCLLALSGEILATSMPPDVWYTSERCRNLGELRLVYTVTVTPGRYGPIIWRRETSGRPFVVRGRQMFLPLLSSFVSQSVLNYSLQVSGPSFVVVVVKLVLAVMSCELSKLSALPYDPPA